MAQKIVTVCDIHAAEDKEMEGYTWQITVAPPGEKGEAYAVDLCGEHSGMLAELQQLLSEHGRKVSGRRTAAQASAGHFPCPAPECDYSAPSRDALSKHTRGLHGKTIPELTGEPTPYECEAEGCGRSFSSRQGRAVHRRLAHQLPPLLGGSPAA